MATLSKTVMDNIALKMVEKSFKYSQSVEKQFTQTVSEIYEQQIPDEVKKCFKSNPDRVETTAQVYVDSHGFSRKYFKLI